MQFRSLIKKFPNGVKKEKLTEMKNFLLSDFVSDFTTAKIYFKIKNYCF
jgi:hypothetical protein